MPSLTLHRLGPGSPVGHSAWGADDTRRTDRVAGRPAGAFLTVRLLRVGPGQKAAPVVVGRSVVVASAIRGIETGRPVAALGGHESDSGDEQA